MYHHHLEFYLKKKNILSVCHIGKLGLKIWQYALKSFIFWNYQVQFTKKICFKKLLRNLDWIKSLFKDFGRSESHKKLNEVIISSLFQRNPLHFYLSTQPVLIWTWIWYLKLPILFPVNIFTFCPVESIYLTIFNRV